MQFTAGVVVPPEVFGLEAYAEPTAIAPKISRRQAIQCGAVSRAYDLIPGTLGTLPIQLIGPGFVPAVSSLFEQPEPDVARSVTMTQTFADLWLDEVAWWRVLEFGDHGYPTKVRRLDPDTVDVRRDQRVYVSRTGEHHGAAWEWIPDDQLIRFDSPVPGLLEKAARAIRVCLRLEASSDTLADGRPPVDYFVPAEGADPVDDTEIEAILVQWLNARRKGKTGYVPAALEYKTSGWNPEQLQLDRQREQAVIEVARHAGVDPEELGVSVTSRTYQNGQQRRLDLIDFTLAKFMIAFTDRLSMNDVCPAGYRSRFDLDNFTRADTKSRYEAYQIGLNVGALAPEEIRAAEQRPPIDPPAATTPTAGGLTTPADDTDQEPATMSRLASTYDGWVTSPLRSISFDTPTHAGLQIGVDGAHTFTVDRESRTIRGLLVPYGVPAKSKGQWWRFAKGALRWADPRRVKLWMQHDPSTAIGYAIELDDRTDGLYGAFKIAATAKGDEALELAAGPWDGFSIGLGEAVRFTRNNGINDVTEAPLMETSLTPAPSFDGARVHTVAATADTEGTPTMEEETAPTGQAPTTAATTTPETATTTTTTPPDFSAITDAIRAGFTAAPASSDGPTVPARETVPAGTRPTTVDQAAPYRFDGTRGDHDFSTDLFASLKFNDSEATDRLMKFMETAFAPHPATPQFAVTSAGTAALNPPKQRPDMYVDQLDYTTPLYDALYKGAIEDATPFVFPKFKTASGLVADHTAGTEPTPGSFEAESQTVTPTPVSGKVEIPREVWDQGGNPQVSVLIWNEMTRAWRESLEARAGAELGSLTGLQAMQLTAGGVDDALVDELEAKIAALQFIRGGNRFRFMPLHVDLFLRLAAAKGDDGRKLLPMIGPSNANGTAEPLFSRMNVAGMTATPAWSLGASAPSTEKKSYAINPADVHVWNTAPKRLQFEYRLAYVDLAVWGYAATATSRKDGVQWLKYKANA